MADVQPLRTLRYEPAAVGSLEAVIAPPYDVIDDRQRAELAARSPFNVVEIDLPRPNGGDPYLRTHPGPKEDRLRLTVATRANLSAIFSLFPDLGGAAEAALEQAARGEPFAV